MTPTLLIVRRISGTYSLLLRRGDGTESIWRSGIQTHDEAYRRAAVVCSNLGYRLRDLAKEDRAATHSHATRNRA